MSTHPFQNYDDVKGQAPLYTPPPQPTIPGPEALPADIREFLTNALCVSRGLSLDHASAIASKWRLGTGRELRGYPPKMYFDIFGPEDGWCVYKEVKTRLLKQTYRGPVQPDPRDFLIFLCLVCTAAAYISFSVARSASRLLLLRVIAGIASVLLMIFVLSIIRGGTDDLRNRMRPRRSVDELVNETVEKELTELMANGDTIKKK